MSESRRSETAFSGAYRPEPSRSETYCPEPERSSLYSPQEVQQILNLAIARQMASDTLSHAQLLEIADEMGISAAELAIAEQDWRVLQSEAAQRLQFDGYRQNRLRRRAIRYLIVNGFLAAIAAALTGAIPFSWFAGLVWFSWVAFPVTGWGMLLVLNAWNVYGVKGDRYESAFQGWRRRRQLKRSVSTLLNRLLGS